MRAPLALLGLSGLVLTAGCANEPAPDECGYPKPAFSLSLATRDGAPLPEGTKLTITFGGGAETIYPGALPASPKVAFCHLETLGSGATSLVCALWTDGAAAIDVVAPGYEPVAKTAEAHSDRCGIVTTPWAITLEKTHGSPP